MTGILTGIGSLLGGIFGSKKKKKAQAQQTALLAHVDKDLDALNAIVGKQSTIMYVGFGILGLIIVLFIVFKRRR